MNFYKIISTKCSVRKNVKKPTDFLNLCEAFPKYLLFFSHILAESMLYVLRLVTYYYLVNNKACATCDGMIKGWDGGLAINGGCWDLVTAAVEDDEDDCDDVSAAGGELLLLLSTTGSGTETIQRMVEISSDFPIVVGFSRENVLVVVILLDDSLLSVGGVDEGGDDVGDGQGSHRAFRCLEG